MTEAYKRLNMKLEIKTMPGERALAASNGGDVDGELYRKKDISVAYPNLVVIPVAIISVDEMAYVKNAKAAKISDWASLGPYNVGYRKGIKLIEDNIVAGTKTTPVATLEQLFKMLEEGRIDVAIETNISGLETIGKLGLSDIVMLDAPIAKSPLYHCLNVKNQKLAEPLTAVLRKMEKDGTILDIQKKAMQELLAATK